MIFPLVFLAAAAAAPGAAVVASPQPAVYAHHAVSTADPQTQATFDRGLTLFYAYNGAEGVHVFQAIERREPKLAMSYWGEALSLGRDINTPLTQARFAAAHTAIEKAAALEFGDTTAQERAYISAMRVRYAGNWSNRERDEAAYRTAMAAAVAENPRDNDLAALYAEALLENGGANRLWKSGTSQPAGSDSSTIVNVLDGIIAREPTHIMANHLLIHVFEPSTDRTRALVAARRL
ncbi:MAG: hypothetical protein M3M96_05685, partial [Candidatus Eremiobacteraeota bacterium]|nr:hypothetical protein [Candidatus Eremiobacteraeota bacterium]